MEQPRIEIFSLLNFKRLAENHSNHEEMLNDSRILKYIERGLDTCDEEIIKTSLRILELLTENRKSCEKIRKVDSVKVSLKNLIERPFGVTPPMRNRAEKIVRALDSNIKPLSKEKLSWPRKILTLQVQGLHNGTRKELEDILTKKVKGVLTITVDVEHQRCNLTVFSHVEPKILAEALSESGIFHAQQVLRNYRNQEILVSLIDSPKHELIDNMPEYLEEEEPVAPNAVRSRDFRVTASEWFLTTAGFLQRSMYW